MITGRREIMDGRTLVNTGMAYSEKTMEAADEVIQALIIALSGKSTAGQNHVLRGRICLYL